MNNNRNFQNRYYSPHIGVTFYKEFFLDLKTAFGVRGKIEPKIDPQSNYCFGRLLKKRLLLSGDSKSLALLGYCYTIEGLHLILQCQNWWTLPLTLGKVSSLLIHRYIQKSQICPIKEWTEDYRFCIYPRKSWVWRRRNRICGIWFRKDQSRGLSLVPLYTYSTFNGIL